MNIKEKAQFLLDKYKRGFLDEVIPELEKLSPLQSAYIVSYICSQITESNYLSPETLANELFEVLK